MTEDELEKAWMEDIQEQDSPPEPEGHPFLISDGSGHNQIDDGNMLLDYIGTTRWEEINNIQEINPLDTPEFRQRLDRIVEERVRAKLRGLEVDGRLWAMQDDLMRTARESAYSTGSWTFNGNL
jgi:hypothetical protein